MGRAGAASSRGHGSRTAQDDARNYKQFAVPGTQDMGNGLGDDQKR